MGQQQLLLLVIGVVLVGIAVVTGFYAYAVKADQSTADNLLNRSLTIASEAVFWKTKMDPYNGGNARYTGLGSNGLQTLALAEETSDGIFEINSATDNALQITGVSKRNSNVGVRVFIEGYEIVDAHVRFDGTIALSEMDGE